MARLFAAILDFIASWAMYLGSEIMEVDQLIPDYVCPPNRVFKWIKRTWLVPIVAMPLLIITFHYGFFILSPRKFKILASHALPNKTELYVVIRKSGDLAEPYLVNLYRKDSNGVWDSYYLAHEDSYWWGCALVEDVNNRVVVRTFGEDQADYDIKSDKLHFAEDRPDTPAVRASPWFLDSERKQVVP